MDHAYLAYVSMRRFFGSLVPGFAWVLLLAAFLPKEVGSWIQSFAEPVRYAAFILTSYVLGVLNIHLVFNLLALLGDGIDHVMRGLGRTGARPILQFISGRLHILDLTTLEDDWRSVSREDPNASSDSHAKYKLTILDRSPALSKEALDKEGDINFYAGMAAPVVGLGIWLLARGISGAGILTLVVAFIFALRFQHLRHDEISFLKQAYTVVRDRASMGDAKDTVGPNS